MICCGLTVAVCIIKRSVSQWMESPVITTLNTISAHVSDIQFPTVTVCPEQGTIPNGWGYIQTLLDQIDYNCPMFKNQNCTNAVNLKEQTFDFFFKSIASVIDETLEMIDIDTLKHFLEGIQNEKEDKEPFNQHGPEQKRYLVDLAIKDIKSNRDFEFILQQVIDNRQNISCSLKFGSPIRLPPQTSFQRWAKENFFKEKPTNSSSTNATMHLSSAHQVVSYVGLYYLMYYDVAVRR